MIIRYSRSASSCRTTPVFSVKDRWNRSASSHRSRNRPSIFRKKKAVCRASMSGRRLYVGGVSPGIVECARATIPIFLDLLLRVRQRRDRRSPLASRRHKPATYLDGEHGRSGKASLPDCGDGERRAASALGYHGSLGPPPSSPTENIT
jgi:hypothetical protein